MKRSTTNNSYDKHQLEPLKCNEKKKQQQHNNNVSVKSPTENANNINAPKTSFPQAAKKVSHQNVGSNPESSTQQLVEVLIRLVGANT